jgi:hypothetical protein
VPVLAADGVSGITGVRRGKNTFYFEPMPSGPQPLRNLIRPTYRSCGLSSSGAPASRESRPRRGADYDQLPLRRR